MNFGSITYLIVNILFFIFAASLMLSYLLLTAISIREMARYLKKNQFVDYRYILSSPLAPGISIIAPAYNEGLSIIDNVKSLLSIMYNNYEVVIINDGSKDDSMAKLMAAYQLVKVPFDFQQSVPCKNVIGIYKSTNKAFKKLTVVDKENGGKADALNAGINVAQKELVACIDVDCIIEPDALLKMVKPFLEESKPVIASGGVVRIANNCIVEEGRLIEVKLPDRQIARFQVLEYLRAFLLGRMAWSRLNGLLLISGAFGLFRKDVVIKVGGYDHNTVGEDMELVVRMRRYMQENKLPYQVAYIPDPLCWTEAPSNYKVLGRQRNRWTRGTFETLKIHRKLFFNYKYGFMGMISYPFWFFYEWLAPFVEAIGILLFLVLAFFGLVDWGFFLALLFAVYGFALLISNTALLAEENSFFKYTQKRDVFKMFWTSVIEPFWFHPRVVYWSIRGNIDLIKGKKNWGEMNRQGFVKYKKKQAA